MPLSPQIIQMIDHAIDDLIQTCDELVTRLVKSERKKWGGISSPRVLPPVGPSDQEFESGPEFSNIKNRFVGLLMMLPDISYARHLIEQVNKLEFKTDDAQQLLGLLRAFKDSHQSGWMEPLINRIETDIASDYMAQADSLLGQGGTGMYDHVPAAVLAGAVLEENLRSLCQRQSPPIPVTHPRGDPKTLAPLIQTLQTNNIIDKPKADLLNFCARIRNHAAHGQFSNFTKQDVETMLKIIKQFLANL